MAILKSELDDQLLTKSERSVVRTVKHAEYLNESILSLRKILISMQSDNSNPMGSAYFSELQELVLPIEKHLSNRLYNILKQLRLPESPASEQTESS